MKCHIIIIMVLVDEDLEYEINENGECVLVRSFEATHPVYLRFRNVTGREVNVGWRDYRGKLRSYVALRHGSHYDVNTFATHPWQFTDCHTKERYVINNKRVFRPPANQSQQFRTNWNITIGVRTLKHTALLNIALRLREAKFAHMLDLPVILANELNSLVLKLNTAQRGIER